MREMIGINEHFNSVDSLMRLHTGISGLPLSFAKRDVVLQEVKRLTAHEYVITVQDGMKKGGGIAHSLFEASIEFGKNNTIEIRSDSTAGVQDIIFAYNELIRPLNGKILLLFDEAGSINGTFFRNQKGDSYFEILMNQLRTLEFVRTKIAIYPHSDADILIETRYGDSFLLEERVTSEEGYISFRSKAIAIIENYVENESGESCRIEDLFEASSSSDFGDAIEQIIYASNGNMRRFIYLLDLCMEEAYLANRGAEQVTKEQVLLAIKKHSTAMENHFTENELTVLAATAKTCRSRSTYQFRYSGMSNELVKYVTKSPEYNVLKIVEKGAGRKGTVYAFDFAYCVKNDIPTHYVKDTERIDRDRSLSQGGWIRRISNITRELTMHADIVGKIEGEILFVLDPGGSIRGEDGVEYFMLQDFILKSDKKRALHAGLRVRFLPRLLGEIKVAEAIELL